MAEPSIVRSNAASACTRAASLVQPSAKAASAAATASATCGQGASPAKSNHKASDNCATTSAEALQRPLARVQHRRADGEQDQPADSQPRPWRHRARLDGDDEEEQEEQACERERAAAPGREAAGRAWQRLLRILRGQHAAEERRHRPAGRAGEREEDEAGNQRLEGLGEDAEGRDGEEGEHAQTRRALPIEGPLQPFGDEGDGQVEQADGRVAAKGGEQVRRPCPVRVQARNRHRCARCHREERAERVQARVAFARRGDGNRGKEQQKHAKDDTRRGPGRVHGDARGQDEKEERRHEHRQPPDL